MERRDFIRLTAISMGAGFMTPVLAKPGEDPITSTTDIYYTKEHQGRWDGKAATHLATIQVVKTAGKVTVNLVTPHEMKGHEHYIVKHVLLDKNYKFLDEHLFDPTKETEAKSSFTLENYSGDIYALSLCNKHDLWLSKATV